MRYFLIILFALLTACGSTIPTIKPFKMDIQQGNVVTSKMLLQLRPGMTKSQVKFIMGSPLIIDSFHTNRWDYFYQLRQAGKIVEQRRVILDFDKDLLTKVRGDVVPEGSAGAASGTESSVAKTITVEPKPKQEEGMLDKLKFWKEDEKANAIKPEAAKTNDAVNLADEKSQKEKSQKEKSWSDKLKFWKKEDIAKDKDAVKTSREKTDALEANSSAPAGDAPSIDVPNVNAPNVDMPSVLAVPIGGVLAPDAPAEETPTAQAPAINSPAIDAPAVEAPVTSAPIKAEPVIVAPAIIATPVEITQPVEPPTAAPMPATKSGERLIFRLDRNLDLKNLEAPVVAVPEVTLPKDQKNMMPTSAKPNKLEQPLPIEEAPGYFERMLEKIGF